MFTDAKRSLKNGKIATEELHRAYITLYVGFTAVI